MESQPPFYYFLFTPSSVRPSASSTHTTKKAATVAAAAPTSPNARPIQKSHNMKPKRRYFLWYKHKPTRRISLEHLAKLREREKPNRTPTKKKNTPLVLNKHTFLHPTTLPTHTHTKQASKQVAQAPTTPSASICPSSTKSFFTPTSNHHNTRHRGKKKPTKENLKPQRQATPSLSVPPSPDIARPALLQRQKNNKTA